MRKNKRPRGKWASGETEAHIILRGSEEYSYNAQAFVPDKFLITATCANGGEGYLPSKLAFEQGGYEVISSHFTPDLEESILKAAEELLKH